jgi:hypothetical protein
MNDLAIEITWAIGLVGILIPTIIVLKQVAVILRVLKHIEQLGARTLDAARGIRQNVAALEKLPLLKDPAVSVQQSTASITVVAQSLVARLPLRS